MRNSHLMGLALLVVVIGLAAVLAQTQPASAPAKIDWAYARQLIQKSNRGEALTEAERVYLEQARKEYARRGGIGPASRPGATQPGGRARPAFNQPATQATGLVPLTQMTGQDRYKGQEGGLYGGGRNEPPEGHRKAAETELAKIRPLTAEGEPADDGRIVLISIGMSNTTGEFQVFKRLADTDADRNPQLTIVDCAQGGATAAAWSGRGGNLRPWEEAERRLRAAGVTPRQVQVAWVKQANSSPAGAGAFPGHAEALRDDLIADLNIARQCFPNLRIAYLSSRIYGGYAVTALNPEPYAYEGAFAVRWVIQEQIEGDKRLNYDPGRGQVQSPLLLWGPYLWGDGMTPRRGDGLIWKAEDFAQDGTHPSLSGREKVARMVLEFFKTNELGKGWFMKAAGAPAGDRMGD